MRVKDISPHFLTEDFILLKFYNIKENYVNYIRKFDARIYENKNRRPYVGVVCIIEDIKYYVPLSSPKPKYQKMKNTKDFHKINGGIYGAVNFNYMIPVKDSDLTEIDINNEPDIKYKNLLQNQYFEVIKIEVVICNKALALHKLTQICDTDLTPNDKKVKDRCCNFTLLEEKMNEYVLLSN